MESFEKSEFIRGQQKQLITNFKNEIELLKQSNESTREREREREDSTKRKKEKKTKVSKKWWWLIIAISIISFCNLNFGELIYIKILLYILLQWGRVYNNELYILI